MERPTFCMALRPEDTYQKLLHVLTYLRRHLRKKKSRFQTKVATKDYKAVYLPYDLFKKLRERKTTTLTMLSLWFPREVEQMILSWRQKGFE